MKKDFQTYDRENPQIWAIFQKFALEAKQKGFKKYSAKGIFEIIRWHTGVSGNDKYKVNNNYTADYARKMMMVHPEFDDFFIIRDRK